MALDRSLVSRLAAFSALDAAALDHVLAAGRSMRHAKDTAIFTQDEPATRFFLLLSGHIRVVRGTPDGDQVIARYINEGELFGIAVAMGLNSYPASAVAAVDCVAIQWPNSAWHDFQARHPAFARTAFGTVGARLQETQSRVVELSTRQVEQRIANAVLRLVTQSGRKTPEGIEIDFPITRQDIAEMTGSTLHTVSRLLSGWEEEGIVRSGRQRVTVVDPHALMLIAENRRQK